MSNKSRKPYLAFLGLFCVVTFLYLFQNTLTASKIKLSVITHPFPAANIQQQVLKEICIKSWELLEQDHVFTELINPQLNNDIVLNTINVDGCVLRLGELYNHPDNASRRFKTIVNQMMKMEGWEANQLEGAKESFIFSSPVHWNMKPIYLDASGESVFYILVIRRCRVIGLVMLMTTKENELFSPGVKLNRQEIFKYSHQIEHRIEDLFCHR